MHNKANKRLGIAAISALMALPALADAPNKPSIAWMPASFENGNNITVEWNMWWGTNGTNWTLTGNSLELCDGALTPNGSNEQGASCSVDLAPGQYTLQVALCNSDGCSLSDTKTIQVAGGNQSNIPPSISLYTPDSAETGTTIELVALASDSDGEVTSVSFFYDGALLATDTTAPYSADFVADTAGSYTFSATATDDAGAESSASKTVVVNDPACNSCNEPPAVSVSAPTSAEPGEQLSFTASASDVDGSIASVQFLLNGETYGPNLVAPPYTVTWEAELGQYEVSAVAIDDDGAETTSNAVQVNVSEAGTGSSAQPATPQMDWLGDQSSTDFTVGWNIWWGENGSFWRVLANDEEIYSAALSSNSPNAQSASATVSVASAGQYSIVVEVCNSDATVETCSRSAASTITIAGGGNDGGGDDGDGGTSPWDYLSDEEWQQRKAIGPGANNVPYTNSTGKMVGAYFVEWGVYGRKFYPKDIPVENLTHIFYGFIPICGPNDSLTGSAKSALDSQCSGKPDYTVVVHDKFAALEKNDFDGTATWDDEVKGIFAEMYRMKMAYPHIKIVPSVGGWTLSDPLYEIGINPEARAVFIDSIIDFIDTYDFFDGIDIDWEFPGGGGANTALGTAADGEGFADLMIELRAALDVLEVENDREYELTAAMSGGVEKLSKVNWQRAAPVMDFINLMTYDYYGAWNTTYGHQTGLYDTSDQLTSMEGFNINDAVNLLLDQGIPASKVAVGVAMYGRGWEGIQGGTQSGPYGASGGSAISGTQEQGFWEKGIMDYKGAETYMMGGPDGQGVNGFTLFWDDAAKASYLWNPTDGKFVTLDTPRSVVEKGQYVLDKGLGGVFAWEIDADNGNILNAMHEGLGHTEE